MVHRRRVTVESSSSSEPEGSDSDFSSASSHKTSPTSPVEDSAPSAEPLKCRKWKRNSSDNGDNNKAKCSKRSQLQKEDNEEPSYPERAQDPGEIHIAKSDRVPQAIRASDLTLGLRRIPAGFHLVFEADGAEYQTSNKSVHVDQAVVEWHERILLPRELSSKVRVSVYASFELGPMLCHGELLRTFEISVGELLSFEGRQSLDPSIRHDFNKRSKDSPGRSPVLLHESASSTSNVTKVTVQTAPSSAELNAQQVARLLHSLSGPVINLHISRTPQDIRQCHWRDHECTSICKDSTWRIVLGQPNSRGSRSSVTQIFEKLSTCFNTQNEMLDQISLMQAAMPGKIS
ncbi:hypothetical protein P692DRAFT_201865926 [Suillus brevipes Sb2]|nr:hypothetical protein P692DRAFT_201865926 [Suillus brevipes Sb2]